MAGEFEQRLFGSYGEMLPPPSRQPSPPPQPFVIPPWPEEERRLEQAAAAEAEPLPTALEQIKANEDAWDPPSPVEAPATFTPLIPVQIPEADWRQEELDAARRDEPGLLEELPAPHPPPRRELA
jgi:hypothetical protein